MTQFPLIIPWLEVGALFAESCIPKNDVFILRGKAGKNKLEGKSYFEIHAQHTQTVSHWYFRFIWIHVLEKKIVYSRLNSFCFYKTLFLIKGALVYCGLMHIVLFS